MTPLTPERRGAREAREAHQEKLAGIMGWEAAASDQMEADIDAIESEAVDRRLAELREELEGRIAEHRKCGPKYEGCYAHFPTPHCRADGMAWPCDVDAIRLSLTPAAPTPEGEKL